MKRLQRIAVSLLIAVVLYSNVAIIFNYPMATFDRRFLLPLPERVNELFSLFNVFSYYELANNEVEIYGIVQPDPASTENYFIQLNIDDYFPFRRGQTLGRIQTAASYGPAQDSQRRAFQDLAKKIRDRFNRMNPTMQIQKVKVVLQTWPRSFESYDQLKSRDFMTQSTVFSE